MMGVSSTESGKYTLTIRLHGFVGNMTGELKGYFVLYTITKDSVCVVLKIELEKKGHF